MLTDPALDAPPGPLRPHRAGILRIPLAGPLARELTEGENGRYARQLAMPEIGGYGQARLGAARVLVVGAGGLGSPVLDYLGRAGVGVLTVVDDDQVAASNLHRQTMHDESGIGVSKARSAATRLREVNPLVHVVAHDVRLTSSNADAFVADADLVIDATDNYATRYIIADATARAGIPCIWGAVLGTIGQASTFWSGAQHGAVTLRDLYPHEPEATDASCATVGVLGPLCGIVASWMAAEAMKLIVGFGTPLLGRLLSFDLEDGTLLEIPLRASTEIESTSQAWPREQSKGHPLDVRWIGVEDLSAKLRLSSPVTLIDVRELWERDIARIEGSISVPLAMLDRETIDRLPDGPLIVHCHHDGRARRAADVLAEAGREDVQVLRGGIDAWAYTVDTSLARY